jgi:MoxR-like ATPase
LTSPEIAPPDDLLAPAEVERARSLVARVLGGLERVLFDQTELAQGVLIALLARGHVLLEGLPGLGKTELVKALARLSGLQWRRLQFTPDLLPGDITGGAILETDERGGRRLRFQPGPVFTQVLLADEINRASPKSQSALLEAMQERRVSVLGETHPLPEPFLVLATQNPIELEGTYPLPEAQLDRFLFKLEVQGVGPATLERILTERRAGRPPELAPVLAAGELSALFVLVDRVFLPRAVANFIARLVSASHPSAADAPSAVRQFVRHGASPRAAIALAEAARARALVRGKPTAGYEDVEALAPAALAHRLVLDYRARLEGQSARQLVAGLLSAVPRVAGELANELGARS